MDTPVLRPDILGLSKRQVTVANLVFEEFVAAGFGAAVAAAAVVNAFAESSLNPSKVSPSGKFVGLFQVSTDVLAEDRDDARKNTRAIIAECRRAPDFMALAKTSSDIFELAEAFCLYVERPSKKDIKCMVRADLADRLYPQDFLENAPEALTPRAPAPLPTGFTEEQRKWFYWGIVAVVLGGGYWYTRRVKARLAAKDAGRED